MCIKPVVVRGKRDDEASSKGYRRDHVCAADGRGCMAGCRLCGRGADSAEIYVMDVEIGKETRQTDNRLMEYGVSWSPGGRRIAFVSERDGDTNIPIMDTDGANQGILIGGPSADYLPAWSPDGTRLAFHGSPRQQRVLWGPLGK